MPKKRNEFFLYAKYSNVALSFGLTLVVSVVGGGWLGSFLDNKFHSFPVFMVIGILSGTVLSFWSLFELLTGMEKTDFIEHEEVSPVYQRAMNLRRLYFKKARVNRGENPTKRKE